MTPAQHRLLRVAKAQLGLDDEAFHAVLLHVAGAESSTHLDNAGFDRVLDYLKTRGFTPRLNRRRGFGERPGMASPGQVKKIQAMWADYLGRTDPAALDKWLHNKFHCSSLRFATPDIAQKAITALTRMVARPRKSGPENPDKPGPEIPAA